MRINSIYVIKYVQKYQCGELVWAGYMKATKEPPASQINIAKRSYPNDYGDTGYTNATYNGLRNEHDRNIDFEPDNIPPKPFGNSYEGTVDGNLPTDDPENNTWTTVQKAIDNLSSLDVLYIKNGTYSENIVINKSIIIIGESKNNVTIKGYVTSVVSHDYELPENCEFDFIANVNMTGNELLLKFNNDSDVGENYSSSDNLYDYSITNNATKHDTTWTSETLKGNGSMDFNGINNYVNLTSVSALTGENVTISAWIYWEGGSGSMDPIVSQSNTTQGYCLYINCSDNKPYFRLDNGIAVSSISINNGWHNVVGTHNKTALKIFVDGKLRGSFEKTGSGINKDAYVGFDNISSYYNGMIDEVSIWNKTLSADEISNIYRLNYGPIIINLTIKDEEIGVIPCNNTHLVNCNIINNSVGIQINNVSGLWILCNISECDTGIEINNSHPEEQWANVIGLCNIVNCTNGSIINSSSNQILFYNYFNCSKINVSIVNCNYNKIYINNCTSSGNVGPDTPSLSGSTVGDPGVSYTYYSTTNESDNESLFYQFYWGDGNNTGVLGPYSSNVKVNASHAWTQEGGYYVDVVVKDIFFNESWSKSLLFRTETLPPLINSVNHTPDLAGYKNNITIMVNVTDDQSGNYSGISYVKVNITYPDDTTGNYSMNCIGNDTYTYNFTKSLLIGQYNYTIWAIDNAYNTNISTGYNFTVAHLFGCTTWGSLSQSVKDRISGSVFTILANGTADNITAYIQTNLAISPKTKCMIHRRNDSTLIGTTQELTPNTGNNPSWIVFTFSDSKPTLIKNTEYVLTCWSNDTCNLSYDNITTSGRYKSQTYGTSPNPISWTANETRKYSIYCSYTTKPEITGVSDTPSTVGFGFGVTLQADTDDIGCGTDVVKINVTYPNSNTANYTMSNTEGNTYQYSFDDTWSVGQYNYTIWARDKFGSGSIGSGYSFDVSANATISICTIKDTYGNNEIINITDPPSIGYELLDNDTVLHMWNQHNSYYFNTSSGIQLTNHFNEYWSNNVLMLGYYNNNKWNLIYRTDELSGFNRDIDSDNLTYINATLWKDLTYKGYEFRLAIRYHLGVNDSDLIVIPFIKNLGDTIPYTLAFGWEINDIKIAYTYENDSIRLFNGTDWTCYTLNQTLNNTYSDMDYNTTFILEGSNEGKYFRRALYLKWNHTLDYLLKVKSREGQYNAPVTLFIKIGTLAVDQEKYTMMNWLDSDAWLGVSSSELVYACENKFGLGMALDGIELWTAETNHDHEFILDLGKNYSIKKFKGRSNSLNDPTDVDIYISTDNSTWGTAVTTDISTWQDTDTWTEVDSTDKTGQYIKVVVQDTEDANSFLEWGGFMPPGPIFDAYGEEINIPPVISNPYPEHGASGIAITPTLNITVSDDNGDTMIITWLSNSSGSWLSFGTNTTSDGTCHQTFSNATENGKWWYWKVNVSDGTTYTVSSVYKFYTGYQSKIVNTGTTSIKGYLLIQVQFYNTTTSMWVVDNDTTNETAPRTIHWNGYDTPNMDVLALDTIFNGLVNTNDLAQGSGTYRVYVAFRDPNGNILKCDDETELVATYQFTVTLA
jgi:hypothetical protein